MIARNSTLVIDVRDAPEVEKSGKVAGAINVSRACWNSVPIPRPPYHDKSKTLILYCASGGRRCERAIAAADALTKWTKRVHEEGD
jgi:rhodanese-related sulfurtransferase